MKKQQLIFLFICIGLTFFLPIEPHAADETKPQWQAEWGRTVEAAHKEGEVVLYGGDIFETVFRQFHTKYPKIKVSQWGIDGAGANVNAQRLLMERRAGLYGVDIWIGGVDTSSKVLLPAKTLVPIKPLLILPEVLDPSNWWTGKHYYADLEGKYIFIFEGSAQSGGISYNTRLVNPKEIQSYWELVQPKWKGKIVSTDPLRPGTSQQNLRFFYYNPELGPEFIQRLFGEMSIVISRDKIQMVNWLATGKYAFAFSIGGGVEDAKKQGLPVDDFYPGSFKEGALVDSRRGGLALLSRAPHPNAAKLALNWFLSREGQKSYQEVFFREGGSGGDSMREDIPKDDVRADARRLKGVKYLFTGRPEWIDMKPIHDLINKTLAEAKKR